MIGANGLIARRRPLMLSTCRMLSGKSRARHADLSTHLVSEGLNVDKHNI